MSTSNIAKLNDFGQAPWYDNITRAMVREGGLERLIRDDGIRGVTSNPTIFEKAIAGGEGYDEAIAEAKRAGDSIEATFWDLAVDDIGRGADLLRPVHDSLGGKDGFISIEVSPKLAHDTDASAEQAKELFGRLGRPNVMIKIPATPEGLPAITRTIGAGINVNVTLIFALERYGEVIDAYMSGLEQLAAAGGDLSTVHSVASFFVSRVDTEVDRRLPEDSPLRGKAAVANAKLAYEQFRASLATDRWQAARGEGRDGAAPALGVDVDQERRVLPHAVRRHPHRARHGEHAGTEVDRRAARAGGGAARRHRHRGGRGGPPGARRSRGGRGVVRRRHRHHRAGGRRVVRGVLRRPARRAHQARRRARPAASARIRRWSFQATHRWLAIRSQKCDGLVRSTASRGSGRR